MCLTRAWSPEPRKVWARRRLLEKRFTRRRRSSRDRRSAGKSERDGAMDGRGGKPRLRDREGGFGGHRRHQRIRRHRAQG